VERTDAYRAVVRELLNDPEVSQGQVMGGPALQFDGITFLFEHDGQLVLRLGQERVRELVEAERAISFSPPGRQHRSEEWARVPAPYEDWLELAEDAKALAGPADVRVLAPE
jgi:hypothetical protein